MRLQATEAQVTLVSQAVEAGRLVGASLPQPAMRLLAAAGVLDRGDPLSAVLVTEALSKTGVVAPYGAALLLAPLLEIAATETIAITTGRDVPTRFAAEASILVVIDGTNAIAHRISAQSPRELRTNYVYPVAWPGSVDEDIGSLDREAAMLAWRLAIGAELVGAMEAATSIVVEHVTKREQFGQPIGSLQALQHRLAEHAVSLEGARWLVRDAAFHRNATLAASAAAFAASAAHRFCFEAHQLIGARGFLVEFGLHRHTLRMKYLAMEAGGPRSHSEDAARLRWAGPSPA